MAKVAIGLAIFALIHNLNHVPLLAQASVRDDHRSAIQSLDEQQGRYVRLGRDLQELGKASRSREGIDSDIATQLSTVAAIAAGYVDAVSGLLYLFDKITEPVNRANARIMVQSRIRGYAEQAIMADITTASRFARRSRMR